MTSFSTLLPGSVLDLRGQVLDCITGLPSGTTVLGGTLDGKGAVACGVSIDGRGGIGSIRFVGTEFVGFTSVAAKLTQVDGVSFDGCDFHGMGKDAINMVSSSHVAVRRCRFHDFKPVPGMHCDGVQGSKSLASNRYVEITDCDFDGPFQAGFGQFDDFLMARCRINTPFGGAISVTGKGSCLILDNVVTTAEGSLTQARITIAATYGKIIRAGNTVTAFGRHAALAD